MGTTRQAALFGEAAFSTSSVVPHPGQREDRECPAVAKSKT